MKERGEGEGYLQPQNNLPRNIHTPPQFHTSPKPLIFLTPNLIRRKPNMHLSPPRFLFTLTFIANPSPNQNIPQSRPLPFTIHNRGIIPINPVHFLE